MRPPLAASTSTVSPAFANFGREERLLATLCKIGLADEADAPEEAFENIDWRRFAALARRHRVEPLVARSLRRSSDPHLPQWAAAHFREALGANALNNLRFASELVRIADAFSTRGIVSLPLKGLSIATRYYPDIASRHAGDVDILVAPGNLDGADDALRELGYTRISNKTHKAVSEPFVESRRLVHHQSYRGPLGGHLELHFSLHPNPRLLPLTVGELTSAGETVRVGRAQLPALPDALQFVFLSTHGARHKWRRLQWVCDIAAMRGGASPEEVGRWLETAGRFGLTNPAVQGLVIAARLLGAPLPDAAAQAYRRSLRIRFMVRQAEHTIFRTLDEEPDNVPAGLDIGTRLYRFCMTARPDYHWNEAWRGVQSIWMRVARPGNA